MITLVWFRQDLRLNDNPALAEAASNGAVLPVYIHEPAGRTGDPYPLGAASGWWLHHSLAALRDDIGKLLIFSGDPKVILPKLAKECGADAVVWNRLYDPHSVERDTELKSALKDEGLKVTSFKANLLFEPWEVKNKSGDPFKVFTPFWRTACEQDVPPVVAKPKTLDLHDFDEDDGLEALKLLPSRPNWAKGWEDLWRPGEAGAWKRWKSFLKEGLDGYGSLRNRPDLPNVSRLSPHLHFGEISPRQLHHEVAGLADGGKDAGKFMSEVGWREFSHQLLYQFPKLPEDNWRSTFDAYPWRESDADFEAWKTGQTGYPIVDAGMRELWQTGYMHNRVRMIVASFLIKHLRLHWRRGEEWFRDTLVDADLANNAAGWQWVAGSGADAAPYFRIFNPMTQGEKFDPNGDYVRRWVPELARLETKYLNAPFKAPKEVLAAADVVLGKTYPKPIVDHDKARKAALEGFEKVKEETENNA